MGVGITDGHVVRRERGVELIKELEAAGLSRAKIAKRTGFGLRSVYRWGDGANAPHPRMLATLEALLARTKAAKPEAPAKAPKSKPKPGPAVSP